MSFTDIRCRSIRTFLGAKDYDESRRFYKELGFTESIIDKKMSYISVDEQLGFYLSDYYVKDWVNNCMIFLEVEDLDRLYKIIEGMGLPRRYKDVRLTDIKTFDWGREFFMHDPAGNLWHFGCFNDPVGKIQATTR